MSSPRISVITPSYNQSEYIRDNLESVKNQGYSDVEHIVVDGGSDDETVEILKEYESEYDLQWVSERDRGQSHAVNKGFEMANGEWICWQNSDDYFLPHAFSTFDVYTTKYPELDVIYGDVVMVDKNKNELYELFYPQPLPFVQRYRQQFAPNQSMFIRSSTFASIGGLDESLEYVMDVDLCWRLLNATTNIKHVPDSLACFRRHSGAKTTGDGPVAFEMTARHKEELQDLRENRYTPEWYEEFVPEQWLRRLAFGLKAAHLVKQGRTKAFRQKIDGGNK